MPEEAYARTRLDRSAEQFPARLRRDLADQVPQGEIQRPAAPVMEVDVRQHPVMPLDRERILADEQVLVALEAEHAGHPEPQPARPVSVLTRTMVASKCTRGLLSQLALNGGCSGSRWCVMRIDAILWLDGGESAYAHGRVRRSMPGRQLSVAPPTARNWLPASKKGIANGATALRHRRAVYDSALVALRWKMQ